MRLSQLFWPVYDDTLMNSCSLPRMKSKFVVLGLLIGCGQVFAPLSSTWGLSAFYGTMVLLGIWSGLVLAKRSRAVQVLFAGGVGLSLGCIRLLIDGLNEGSFHFDGELNLMLIAVGLQAVVPVLSLLALRPAIRRVCDHVG